MPVALLMAALLVPIPGPHTMRAFGSNDRQNVPPRARGASQGRVVLARSPLACAAGSRTSFPLNTLSDQALLQRAEDSFRAGIEAGADTGSARQHFARSASDYAALHQRGYDNASLMLNAGNASLLAGNLPQAIWAFRHGLDRAPGDRDLRAALDLARAQVAYANSATGRPPTDAWPAWLPRLTSDLLAWIALGAYVIAVLALTRWLMVRRMRYIALATVAALFSLAALGGVYGEAVRAADNQEHPLVVVARDGVMLRRGNGASYPPRVEQPLNCGVEARRLFQRGTWYQVRLATGEVGWLERTECIDGMQP